MQAFHYIYGGTYYMRSPRRSADEQYALVMECRSSGLSDQQWCLQHDIKPGTFYSWIKRLRAKACYDIPATTGPAGFTEPVKQDVVKVDIIPDKDPIPVVPALTREDGYTPTSQPAPIEIRLHDAILRISNDVDPRLLAQILHNLGGCVC